MKKSEIAKKVKEVETEINLESFKKIRQMEAEMELENRESNRNRARSVTVGTSFGGTTELIMRSDGGRHIWCAMQPVEVIELIHQLAANVGCNAQIKPREDFASWRDWRVSEAEKNHLNGHPPFVNDMAVFQQLGASGYDDDEAKKIMDILANVKSFANENDDSKVLFRNSEGAGAPHVMISEEDGLIHNKLALDNEGNVIYVAGGNGGDPLKAFKKEQQHETMATNKSSDKRETKQTTRTS